MHSLNYEVIDNFLPEKDFSVIKDVIMGNDFPWFYNDAITFEDDVGGDLDNHYLTHLFCYHQNQSPYLQLLSPLLSNLNIQTLLRVKANMHIKTNEVNVHDKHVDMEQPHKAAIYYINTNNGYTILEDDTKIESISNRILLFDASRLHCSTSCSDVKRRVNININYF